MIRLMTYGGTAAEDVAVTRTGGLPLVPTGFTWPRCSTCDGALQFLAQVRMDDLGGTGRGLFAVFMCDNDRGNCAAWAPHSGGNRALLLPAEGVSPAQAPPSGRTRLGEVCAVRYADVDAATYYDASTGWAKTRDRPLGDVLGQLGGEPSWLQGDETPTCARCGRRTAFVAQWEEGHDHRTAAYFGGGGCGYGFACEPCRESLFLWQA
ncbi:hypothetical protein [Streptomyces sp. WMMC1477]|uniref:hypothetical protein n=1 Tax=Streptomyces sp. WMMC1477 TaxID=3015155 RepID=UPI0022B74474|nr:hypothetical protein [Streptomyces sp. WMMC1477]MCZ7433806.1 hypothetical protein [Streptomyces sp. WMMC1477]